MPRTILFASAESVDRGSLSGRYPAIVVILKLASRIITHKTDVGGISIVDKDEKEVAFVVAAMIDNVTSIHGPDAVEGVSASELSDSTGVSADELLTGFRLDPAFGR